jgi:hypothetical protein
MDLLRSRARERIAQGRLPRTKPLRTWGGPGVGLPCDLCDAAILDSEPEFELQFDLTPSSSPIRFHRKCRSIWNEVRNEYRPPEWWLVSEQLPPIGALVEARVSLGETRSIILSLLCSGDPATGEYTWVNGTTGAPLPEGWHAVEWRHPTESRRDAPGGLAEPTCKPPAQRTALGPHQEPAPQGSADARAESAEGTGPGTDSREPPVPRRA